MQYNVQCVHMFACFPLFITHTRTHTHTHTQVPVKLVQGKLYVRVSAHVHNELSEFQQLARVISALARKVRCGVPCNVLCSEYIFIYHGVVYTYCEAQYTPHTYCHGCTCFQYCASPSCIVHSVAVYGDLCHMHVAVYTVSQSSIVWYLYCMYCMVLYNIIMHVYCIILLCVLYNIIIMCNV